MPDLYGDFIISNGHKPLHFFGNFDEPNLEGDVIIVYADLKMPQETVGQSSKSTFKYEIKKNKVIIRIDYDSASANVANTQISNKAKSTVKDNEGKNLADLIDYGFNVWFDGKFKVDMDLGPTQQLIAQIGIQDRKKSLRYVKKRNRKQPQLYADILVLPGSNYKFYKVFGTEGKISFPSGDMENPGLDLKAEYSGQTYLNNRTKNYTVKMQITGTKNQPSLRLSYIYDGEASTGDSTQITEDALYLILFGRKKSDLSGGSSLQAENLIMESGTSFLTAYTSKALTELLSSTVIQSADIDLGGGSWEKARVNINGQLLKNVRWRLGGTIADFANNYEISIDIPLGAILQSDLMVEAQVTHSTNQTAATSIDKKDWEVKLKVGGDW